MNNTRCRAGNVGTTGAGFEERVSIVDIRAKIATYLCGMSRWIGIDWGGVRTGIAVTDGDAIIASPLETVKTVELQERLRTLVAEVPCAGFVIGKPDELFGGRTHSSDGIDKCIVMLKKHWPKLPLHTVDEYQTSLEASQAMIAGGMRKKKRAEKGSLDRVAAAIILQRFLAERPQFPPASSPSR